MLKAILNKIKSNRILSITLVLIGVGLAWPVPDPVIDKPFSKILLSREGNLLSARVATDGQWRFNQSVDLPEKYKKALLIYEDKQFYRHPGINPLAIIRAIYQNIQTGKIVSGGSTITMQLARMARANQPRNLFQKGLEAWLALRLELKYSKSEILTLYASNAPFGGNVVGIEAASWRYYGRSMDKLSWAEVANLTVLPNAPGLIFPGSREGEYLSKRNRLLNELFNYGYIDSLELQLSIAEPLPGRPQDLRDYSRHLLDRLIAENPTSDRLISTLNFETQKIVNEIVNEYSATFKFKEIHNASAIIANIENGEVLAYVGNTGKRANGNHGQDIDLINSRRSPGSLLKPVLYALAIDEGLITPSQLLPDVPLYYNGFSPQNFNKKFHGAIHANLALRSSLNVPFVHLLKEYGYEKFHQKLRGAGVNSLDKVPGYYGLTMILGGGEVTLMEMTDLYASLARSLYAYQSSKGELRYSSRDYRPNSLLMDQSANVDEEEKEKHGFISAGALYHMFSAMQDLRRPVETINWERYRSGRRIAWKTGTSYGHKDGWAIGLNSKYVVGVWLGNADGEGRSDLTGINAAAPLLFRLFDFLEGDSDFTKPIADMDVMNICLQTGFKAGPYCQGTKQDLIAKTANNTAICPYHKRLTLDYEEKWQVNSSCYPIKDIRFSNWFILPPSQAWYYRKLNSDYVDPPQLLGSCQTGSRSFMELIYPRPKTKVYVPLEIDGKPGRVVFEAAHTNSSSNVYWHMDDNYIGVTKSNHQLGLYPEKGIHTLSLVDEQGRELSVKFEILNDASFNR